MNLPPWRYMAPALLPVVLAFLTVAVLVLYQRGAENRRDSWQKTNAILGALEVRAGARVAEWAPVNDYFLKRLSGRVGVDGVVYSIRTDTTLSSHLRRRYPRVRMVSEVPENIDAVLLLRLRSVDQGVEDFELIADSSFTALRSKGRMAVIGVAGKQARGFLQAERVSAAMSALGFTLCHREDILPRQYLLVFEKP